MTKTAGSFSKTFLELNWARGERVNTKGAISFNVILRRDFFKNELFKMYILKNLIRFECVENSLHSFTIDLNSITHIWILASKHEIDIITTEEAIFGNFRSNRTMNKALGLLKELLGEKVSFASV